MLKYGNKLYLFLMPQLIDNILLMANGKIVFNKCPIYPRRTLLSIYFICFIFILSGHKVLTQPTITSFTPTNGSTGTSVGIFGSGFSTTPDANIIYFGATRATVNGSYSGGTILDVTVPLGATYQPILVITNSKIAYSNRPFLVTMPGNGAGIDVNSFAERVDVSSAPGTRSVAFGDFDLDGKFDLAVVSYNNNLLIVCKNTSTVGGSISYEIIDSFSTGSNPTSASVGDFDGDGKLDIVTSNYSSNSVSLFQNTSSGPGSLSFASKKDFTAGSGPTSVSAGDLDGDGKADLLTTNGGFSGGNTISVLRNTSPGFMSPFDFASSANFATGSSPSSAVIRDLDEDGKPDVAAGISSGVSVFRNTSTGAGSISFAGKADLSGGNAAQSISIGDLDGDGKADLVVANGGIGINTVSAWRNTSSGPGSISFATSLDFSTGTSPGSVSMGDLDGDGLVDLAVANGGEITISILKNVSTGTGIINFGDNVEISAGSGQESISIGDMNNDDKPDLVITKSSQISALKNVIQPTPLISSFTPESGPAGTSVTISGGDFDVTPANNIVYFGALQATVDNASKTNLVVTVPIGATYQPITVLTDGMQAYSSKPFVLTFTGDDTSINPDAFSSNWHHNTGERPVSISFGDFDGDGKVDLAVANGNEDSVSIFRNISNTPGSINLESQIKIQSGLAPISVSVGDIDGDGLLDLITANYAGNTISVLRNNSTDPGSISFEPKNDFTTEALPWAACIGDIDKDGKPDIAVTSIANSSMSVFRNTSTGIGSISFAPKDDFTTGESPTSVSIGDLDRDGKPDLAVANTNSNTVSIFRNKSVIGSISLYGKNDFTTDTSPRSVSIGDLNGDSKLDLAIANASGMLSVLRNISSSPGSISFASRVSYTAGDGAVFVANGNLDGDGKVDLAVANLDDNTISLYSNTSLGSSSVSFADKIDFITGNGPSSVSIGDLDGDGRPDFVVTNINGDSISVFRRQIKPTAPVAHDASSVGQQSFVTNWNLSQEATQGYYLDVSTDNFAGPTYVSGYNNIAVGDVTSYLIDNNLAAGSTYYYRVRASDGIPSDNSNIISVTTIPPDPITSSATDLEQNSFSANWESALSATNYYLDVATDASFTEPISGSPISVGNTLTHSVTGLQAGTNYYYRVRAENMNGTSGDSDTQTTLTVPPDPVSSTATYIEQTSFSANWEAAESAINYILDVATDEEFANHISNSPFTIGNNLTYNITDLSKGTIYYYRVRSENASGISGNSEVQTLVTIPPDPVSLEASGIEQTSFFANWEASASATNYILDVATDASFVLHIPGSPFDVGNFLTKEITGLKSATMYYYQVSSENENGTSGNSGIQTVITIPANPIPTPAAGVTSNSFQATWNSVTGADYYIVEVSEDDFVSLVARDSLVNQLFADITGLTENTQYKYHVIAGNVSGVSDYSDPISVTTLASPISEPTSQPTGISFSGISSSAITTSFTAAAGNPAGYLALRKVGSLPIEVPVDGTNYTVGDAFGSSKIAYIGSNNSFTSISLNTGTEYYIAIFSYNGTTNTFNYLTTFPLIGSQYTLAEEPSNQPTDMTFMSVTDQSFSVLFSAATGNADGYLVLQRAGSSPGDVPIDGSEYSAGDIIGNSIVAFISGGTNFSISDLNPGTRYYFDVFSYNGSTGYYNYLTSSPLEGNQVTIPGPPDPSTSSISQENFDITWLAVTGANSYAIDVSDDNFSSFVDGYEDKSPGDVLTTTITELSPGMIYECRMRAINTAGTSMNSDTLSVLMVPGTPVLNSPTDVGQTDFTINWNELEGASGYRIDVSEDDFVTNLAAYDDKSVSDTTIDITGLTAGDAYDIRLRSENSSGTSPNSNTITQQLIPAIPVASQAGNVQSTSFVANWLAANGADQYELDATKSSDDFNPNLDGYDALVVTGLSQSVTGLTSGQEYTYRVRAVNATGISTNSDEITVVTATGGVNPLDIDQIEFDEEFMSDDDTKLIEITIQDGVPPYSVSVMHKGILKDSFTSGNATYVSGGSFTFEVQKSMLDILGLEFYVVVTDDVDSTEQSDNETIYRAFTAENSPTLSTVTGGEPKDYRIISIPYVLDDNNVSNILVPDFGPADKEVWRLVHWRNGAYVDYPSVGKIELGKGYWFNSRKTEIKSVLIGKGNVNKVVPFSMSLSEGWNQIGNPYHIAISWNNVRANNNVTDVVDVLRVFDPNAADKFKDGDALEPFKGGFAWSDQTVTLKIHPVDDAGARIADQGIVNKNIDDLEWLIPVRLENNDTQFSLGGVGMHGNAVELKDRFDKMALPRFVEYTEWFTEREDYFYPWFSTDVVPTQNEYRWTFSVESNVVDGNISLTWDQQAIENTISQLWLIDEVQAMVVDMKSQSNYTFDFDGTHEFSIFYSRDPDSNLIPSNLALGNAYPNPVTSSTIIPVILPQMKEQYNLELAIYDLTGKKVKILANKMFSPGYHQFNWNGGDDTGNKVAPGVYVYRLSFNDKNLSTYQKKLILNP